jgi:hypothetical protein
LKPETKNYTAQQLIGLDSCFYLIFNGAAKYNPVNKSKSKSDDLF